MCTLSNHHTHTIIQIQAYIQPCNDVAHRYVTHSHGSSTNTKGASVHFAHFCVHHSLLLLTRLFVNLRQATNMNSYTRNLLVVYGLVTVMTTSYAHCHTIVHIQSYRYNHTHTTMQWCCTQVNESGPWKELYTYNVQVLTVST